jgi:hypothetical protein
VYKIEPASLIPADAEYVFESEEDFKAGDVFQRVGRRLLIERVEDHFDQESETEALSRTLHCRLEADADAWPGQEEAEGNVQ